VISERPERTAHRYRRLRRRACGKQFNERSVGMLNRTQYPSDVVALVVLWRLRYKLSLRELAEINRIEQDHRGIKGRYPPMLGFKSGLSAARFCRGYDELPGLVQTAPNMFPPITVGYISSPAPSRCSASCRLHDWSASPPDYIRLVGVSPDRTPPGRWKE
jgi:hypothetical protein